MKSLKSFWILFKLEILVLKKFLQKLFFQSPVLFLLVISILIFILNKYIIFKSQIWTSGNLNFEELDDFKYGISILYSIPYLISIYFFYLSSNFYSQKHRLFTNLVSTKVVVFTKNFFTITSSFLFSLAFCYFFSFLDIKFNFPFIISETYFFILILTINSFSYFLFSFFKLKSNSLIATNILIFIFIFLIFTSIQTKNILLLTNFFTFFPSNLSIDIIKNILLSILFFYLSYRIEQSDSMKKSSTGKVFVFFKDKNFRDTTQNIYTYFLKEYIRSISILGSIFFLLLPIFFTKGSLRLFSLLSFLTISSGLFAFINQRFYPYLYYKKKGRVFLYLFTIFNYYIFLTINILIFISSDFILKVFWLTPMLLFTSYVLMPENDKSIKNSVFIFLVLFIIFLSYLFHTLQIYISLGLEIGLIVLFNFLYFYGNYLILFRYKYSEI